MIESLKDKNKTIALVGASNDPTKYGNKILLNLKSKNRIIIYAQITAAAIDASLAALPSDLLVSTKGTLAPTTTPAAHAPIK